MPGLNEKQIIIMGAMSLDIWKYDISSNEITPVVKDDTSVGKAVRFLTLGTFAKKTNLKHL